MHYVTFRQSQAINLRINSYMPNVVYDNDLFNYGRICNINAFAREEPSTEIVIMVTHLHVTNYERVKIYYLVVASILENPLLTFHRHKIAGGR
jgi:hypothetical protein